MKRPFRAYEGSEPFVFVCYAHDDAALVYPEIERLRAAGFNIWYDEGISPGSEWSESIAEHIERCAAFLYFVTPRSVNREHCRREVVYALDQPCSMLAVHLEQTDVPPALKLNLSNRQAILRHELSRQAYRDKLAETLGAAVAGPRTDDDGDADRPAGLARPTTSRTRRFRAGALAAVIVLLTLGIAAWYWSREAPEETAPADGQRVAVAEFTYPPGDDRLQRYASLLQGELGHQLSRVSQGHLDVVQAAAEADVVTEGGLSVVGDGVRLLLRVARTDGGNVLWSKRLDLPAEPTEALLATRPEQLATMVWHVVFRSAIGSRLTDNEPAIREWVAGAVETTGLSLGLGGDWNAALAHLKRSSELDPQFILALLELSNLYVNRLGGRLRWADAVGPAHDYVQRALAIYPDGTQQLGWINLVMDLDYDAAQANFEHARGTVGVPPSNTEFNLGLLNLYQGKLDRAIEHHRAALRLGALGNQAAAHLAITLAQFAAGRYAESADAAGEAVTQTAGTGPYAHVPALLMRTWALYYADDPTSARQTYDAAWAAYGRDYPEYFPGLMVLLGETDAARQVLRDAESRWAEGDALQLLAQCFFGHLYLGELDRAFVWLSRGIEERETPLLPLLRRSPILDPIREDPRFAAAMARLAEIEATGTPTQSVAYP